MLPMLLSDAANASQQQQPVGVRIQTTVQITANAITPILMKSSATAAASQCGSDSANPR